MASHRLSGYSQVFLSSDNALLWDEEDRLQQQEDEVYLSDEGEDYVCPDSQGELVLCHETPPKA